MALSEAEAIAAIDDLQWSGESFADLIKSGRKWNDAVERAAKRVRKLVKSYRVSR